MGIYIDNVKLNLKGLITEGTREEKLVKRCISEIKEEYMGRFPLLFKFPDSMAMQREIVSANNWERPTTITDFPKRTIGLEREVEIGGVKVLVRWAREQLRDGTYEPKRKLDFHKNLAVREEDADLAFYLLYCFNGTVNRKEDPAIKLRSSKAVKFIELHDEHSLNVAEFEFNKAKSKVENAISNEMDDDAVKRVAIGLGLPQATTKPAKVLRIELRKRLDIQSQTGGGIDVYLDFERKYQGIMESDKSVENEVRGLVAKALDNNLIRNAKIPRSDGREWFLYNPKDNRRGKRFHEVMPDMSDRESLIEHLLADEQDRNQLEDYVHKMTQ